MLGKNLTKVRSLAIDASFTAQEALGHGHVAPTAALREVRNRCDEIIAILESLDQQPRLINV